MFHARQSIVAGRIFDDNNGLATAFEDGEITFADNTTGEVSLPLRCRPTVLSSRQTKRSVFVPVDGDRIKGAAFGSRYFVVPEQLSSCS
jgi:hypothetical protein